MKTALGQYTHFAAIVLFVVGPAWGFHPLLGIIVTYVSLIGWALASPFTEFDVAIGNAIIATYRTMANWFSR